MSYLSRLAITATVVLLLAGALPASSGAEDGDESTVAVLFDFGGVGWEWVDVPVPDPNNAWCATVTAAETLGIDLEYSFSQYGVFLEGVGDVVTPEDFSRYWGLWIWDGTEWASPQVGALAVTVGNGSVVAWKFGAWGDPPPSANPEMRYPWTQFRGGGAYPGYTGAVIPPVGGMFWSVDLDNGPVDTTLVVAEGKVFGITAGIVNWNTLTFDSPPFVFALNATTGDVVWRHEFQGRSGFEIGSPAYAGGVLYAAIASGEVLALDAGTGESKWSTSVDGAGISSSPTIAGARVLIGTGGGRLVCLQISDGTIEWTANLSGPVYLAAPSVRDDIVYIGTENSTLHALDLTNGSEVWTMDMPGRVRGTPLVLNDRIFVISAVYSGLVATDGFLHSLGMDGKELWNVTIGPTGSSPTIVGPFVAVGSRSGLWYIDPGDGEVVWRYQDAGQVSASPASDLYHVIVVSNENDTDKDLHTSVIMLNGNGTVGWTRVLEPHNWALSSVSVADGVAYTATDAGWVYALGNTPIQADFDIEVDGLEVTVTANSTSVGVDDVEHLWSFAGSADTVLGENITHKFKKGGTYVIEYWFVDEYDRVVNVTKEVEVEEPPEESPSFGILMLLGALAVVAVVTARRR